MKEKKAVRALSLRVKSVLVLLCIALLVSSLAVIISYNTYKDSMEEQYKTLTTNIAKTAASQLDTDALVRYYDEVQKIGEYDEDKYNNDEEYRKNFDEKANAIKDETYEAMLSLLFDIKECNNVEYLYVQRIEDDMTTYLLDADNSEWQCQLGVKHQVSGATLEVDDPQQNGIPAFVSNDTYGWLCSAFVPVLDENGTSVAIVGADVSMDKVVAERQAYLLNTIIIMAGVFLVLIFLLIFGVDYTIVRPINALAKATGNFVSDREKSNEGESDIAKLNVRTGDEIENLAKAIKTMERDIYAYIKDLTTVTAEKERIGAELDVATHIQSSMLPCIFPAFPDREEFDIYATMTPAKEVGGDFYDFFMVDDRHLAIVMADVSGKGVPAALFMVIGKTLLKDHTQPGVDLGDVFGEVNNLLCQSNSEGLFITAFEGVLDLETGEFRYVNAGHEMPFIKKKDGDFDVQKIKAGFVLAGMEDYCYKAGVLQLDEGDMVFQYTDGVTEATNANNELFGMDRLNAVLNTVKNGTVNEVLYAVKAGIDDFVQDAPQFDDITMLALDFRKKMQPKQD